MKITFTLEPPDDTSAFEAQFEPTLQIDPEEKKELICASDNAVWMYVDGKLAGETYGLTPSAYAEGSDDEKDVIEDCDPEDDDSVYCYSTTLLPEFQGKGLGKLLKAYWLGVVKSNGHSKICGHATSPAALKLNELFGAEVKSTREKWYDTDRTAHFYEIKLC